MIKYRKVFGFLNHFFPHFTPFYHLVNDFSMIFVSLAPRLNNKNRIKIDGNFISILLFDVSTSLNGKNRMVHRAVCRFHLLLYLSGYLNVCIFSKYCDSISSFSHLKFLAFELMIVRFRRRRRRRINELAASLTFRKKNFSEIDFCLFKPITHCILFIYVYGARLN